MEVALDKILSGIKRVFIEEDQYGFDKHVWEYKPGGEFAGDAVVFSMAEQTTPPTFYFVLSPYDEVSKKAPQHALVFRDGKVLLDTDYTEYAAMRTGAMDSLVFQTLGLDVKRAKILMFGRGKTGSWSKKFLEHGYGSKLDMTIVGRDTPRDSFDIGQFDIIICHTDTKDFVLAEADKARIKKGAVITNFISQLPNSEVHQSFFDYREANVVVDWKANLARMAEITPGEELIELKDLLAGKRQLNKGKKYSIFRFVGTPLQNLAVLKTLIG